MKKAIVTLLLAVTLVGSIKAQTCTGGELDPRVISFLKLIGYKDQSLAELRATPIEKLKYPEIPVTPVPKNDIQRIKVGTDSIPVLVFNPLHSNRIIPVIINFHGGGFISPLLPALESSLWQEANDFGAIVFAIDYRTAPEHKFPAAVNDSYNAFKWISEHASEFGGDTSQIVIIGNSAGANLAAVVTQKAREDGIAGRIKLQVLNGLPADLRPEHMESSASYQQNASGYFQTKALCQYAAENYASGNYDNPEVSPILASNFSRLPPAVIINTEFDPLRDDGAAYAANLRNAGVKVWEKCFKGQIHLLFGLPRDAEQIKEYRLLVKTAIEAVFSAQMH